MTALRRVEALLVDRDGTIVVDVPYNADPDAVRPVPGAAEALDRVRSAGLPVALVTNQSGIARGYFGEDDLARVQARVDELLGPFAAVEHCPHGEGDGCACRKPRPGMVLAAARRLGVAPEACVMVGDTAADVAAAEAAGALGVLVPNAVTLPGEVAAAAHVARDLGEAVDRFVLAGRGDGPGLRSAVESSWPGPEPGDRLDASLAPTSAAPAAAPAPAPAAAAAPSAGLAPSGAPGRRDGRPVLVARLDNAGDLLLAGPAIRAVARDHPVLLAVGPNGRAAADVLPGVDDVIELAAPWVLADPEPLDARALARFSAEVTARRPRSAAILTSSHQSPLPLALVLRLAGVPEVAGISLDYPGSLLDHRIPGDPDLHEAERALAIVGRLGHELPDGDDGRLAVAVPPGPPPPPLPDGPYVVVHPGASVTARTLAPDRWRDVAAALAAAGRCVVVTGSAAEAGLTAHVAGGARDAVDLGGACSFAQLAAVLAGADAVACGNTGPLHLAAAVGTPVAAVFAPTVPLDRWRPWKVPHVVLGDQGVPCAGCRARDCPLPGQPCLAPVGPDAVVAAVAELAGGTGTGSGPSLGTGAGAGAATGPTRPAGQVVHGTVADLRWAPARITPLLPTAHASAQEASPVTSTPSPDTEEVP